MRALRYPVLWERTAPDGLARADWTWADERLGRLRELGIRPIVGLVHHGSGPPSTSLVDPAFPDRLAEYAGAVAARYPWVEEWTPVNEPLTTARFSGLYGHWYPHGRDDATFARTLVIQCRAVVLAMRAIRRHVPHARLVQTDDLGKTHGTPTLAYQVELENERRWLGFDLLTGLVGADAPMRGWLEGAGVSPDELDWFLENACPPDVVGINHYLSSERFIDERLERYPPESHGGNGIHAYADVLAARVLADGPAGPYVLLRETCERYGLPVAVTETHNGCTREEQLRWLDEVWQAAERLRAEGADVRAVTIWSLLGAVDWDTLLTQRRDRYEPGVFDVSGPQPRATALAEMARALGEGRRFEHPVLAAPAWWRRSERVWYPLDGGSPGAASPLAGTPIVVTGRTGTLGRAVARLCELRGIPYRLLARADLDIADADSVAAVLDELRPWAVVNTAGYVRVDDAEHEVERCRRENVAGPAVLAAACAARGIQLLTFSSDLVFDGAKEAPYVESDAPAPVSVYGRTKAEAEERVLAELPSALVVRTSAFFGPWDEHNFVTLALRALARGEPVVAADDALVSPTYVPDLVNGALDLLIDGERGIWHLASRGETTWAQLARDAAVAAGVPARTLRTCSTEELGLAAPRPLYSVLGGERGLLLPPLAEALGRYVAEREAA